MAAQGETCYATSGDISIAHQVIGEGPRDLIFLPGIISHVEYFHELPAGSGFTKTRLQGKFDVSALDSFNCTSGVDDPLSWVNLANNGTWVAKTS
jgi:hypothetical protein